jgi:hypothetical protein
LIHKPSEKQKLKAALQHPSTREMEVEEKQKRRENQPKLEAQLAPSI